MNILEQTRQRLVLRYGDALLPVFFAAACFIAGLGALIAGSVASSLEAAAVGVLLILAGVYWMLREHHVTLTLDRTSRTLHVRRWRNLMPGESLYRFSEIASYEVICEQRATWLGRVITRLLPLREAPRCMVVANFPTGPDMILVRGLSAAEAHETRRLILMYIE